MDRQRLFIGVDGVAVVADGESAEIQAVDGHANAPRAAIAEDELADAGMDATELAGKDSIDHAAAGENVGRPATEGIFDPGNASGEARPGSAVERAIADLGPAEH